MQDRLSDDRVEQAIGTLLRVSVLVAASVTLLGGVLLLVQHGSGVADYHTFAGEALEFTSVSGVLRGVVALDSKAVTQLGLVLLIATPILRVLFSLVAFAIQRDRLYVLITSMVLAILLFSLFFGGG